MAEKEFCVNGIPSGDSECWCLLVDRETFKRVRGEEPGEFDEGRYGKEGSPYRFMLYPDDLFVGGYPCPDPKPLITIYVKSVYPESLAGSTKEKA